MTGHDGRGEQVEAAILELLAERADDASVCPSEAARRLDPIHWRERMPDVMRAVRRLSATARILVTQRGIAVDPAVVRGPIRLKRP